MAKKLLVLLILSLTAGFVYSQDIVLTGKLQDKTTQKPVQGVAIHLTNPKDSTFSRNVITDASGNFRFSGLVAGSYVMTTSSTNYENVSQRIGLQASNKEPIVISVANQVTTLGDVTVTAKAPPVRQKTDTTEFSASQFKVNPDATAEDMLKKLPGLVVGRDGTVTAMGEQVKKVTVDGRDFFGDDATAALKNLPADVIDKIQVFDRLSDQAQLTGFDDGNSIKTVNIVTKSGIKNGQFGRIYGGIGTDSRYTAGGNVSFFKNDRRLSFVGNFNNINLQNFASQDLLGVTSSGGGGGRGGRGGGGGNFGGGGADFNVGQSSGISKTNAVGVNFSNIYNKKLTLTGSYFFNNSTNTNENLTNTETFGDVKNLFTVQRNNSVTDNNNHRINLRAEYRIDSANTLFIIPSISFQSNNSVSHSSTESFYGINDSTNTSLSNNTSDRDGYNIRNNIMFRHAFPKRGRTISFGFNTTWTKNDGETTTDATYKFYKGGSVTDSVRNSFTDNNTNGHTIGGTIAYTEPLGKRAQLQIDYNPSVQKNKADQQTFNFDGQKYSLFDTALSNRFDNTVTTNNAGVSYRFSKNRDEQLSFGVNFQHTRLESDRVFPTATSVDQTFSNFLPNLMWRKKLSTTSNIRVFYRASTNFPSVSQLQDVVNPNNPLYVTSGNPALKQSYTHFLTGRYSYTNSKTSTSFFANVLLQTASDYITNATFQIQGADSTVGNVKIAGGSQFVKPVNLDGYKSLRTFFTYSTPLKFIKTTLNVNAGFSYSRLPGLANYVNTITNSFNYNAGVVFASNISEFVDFNISYNANFTNSNTNTRNATTSSYVNQNVGAIVNLLNKKGWFLQNDVTGNVYSGLSSGLNQSYWLWNAAIGKKILKGQAGEIKLSVFDLLKQNQSITRTITSLGIEDSQTNVLQQYFMLTFTYKLKNFGTAKPSTGNNRNFQGGPGGPGMMRGGPQF